MKYVKKDEILSVIDFPSLIDGMEDAFCEFSLGNVISPPFMNFQVNGGHIHFKAGYITGDPWFVLKYSEGFWGKSAYGITEDGGLFLLFDAKTGIPSAILHDEEWLTSFRTAAAGAMTSRLLSNEDSHTIAVIGTGMQAKLQVEAHLLVRHIHTVKVWGRNPEHVQQYIRSMKKKCRDIDFIEFGDIHECVSNTDIIITATPSSNPLINSSWVAKGTHILAVGACGPTMQEWDTNICKHADKVYADSIEMCKQNGELHHAIAEKVVTEKDVTGEIGDVITGKIPGRQTHEEITFVDLVGLGFQDTKAAHIIMKKIDMKGLGMDLS